MTSLNYDYQYLVDLTGIRNVEYFQLTQVVEKDPIQRDSGILRVPGVAIHGWMDPDIVPLRYLDEINRQETCNEWVTMMGWEEDQ